MAAAGTSNQVFQGNHIGGNARVHLGNIRADVLNYHPARTELEKQQLEMKRRAESAKQARDTLSKAIKWLGPADTSFAHREAFSKHEPGTGRWFLDSSQYHRWLQPESANILWVHGKPGCCKTVLCSMVIEDIMGRVKDQDAVGLAYFYLSFRDVTKQSYQAWLLATLAQLLTIAWSKADQIFQLLQSRANIVSDRDETDGAHPDIHEWPTPSLDMDPILKDLRFACKKNIKHAKDLEPVVDAALSCKKAVYLVIDGLDESPEGGDTRQDIMDGLNRTANKFRHVKLLVASRRESDIDRFMRKFSDTIVEIEVNAVNADIMRYVNTELDRHPKLSILPESSRHEIKRTLTENANGMFRWVFCQLDQIKRLKLLTPERISHALHNLPTSLDETYERILLEYDEMQEVKTAFEWLAFSVRPLQLQELVEACLLVDGEDGIPTVQDARRDAIKQFILGMSSLIQADYKDERTVTVTLGHYSVKEYLVSDRISKQAASTYHLSEALCHRNLARSCTAYILYACREADSQMKQSARTIHYNSQGKRVGVEKATNLDAYTLDLKLFEYERALEDQYWSIWDAFPLLTYSVRWTEHQRLVESFSNAEDFGTWPRLSMFGNTGCGRFLRFIAACPEVDNRSSERNLSIPPKLATLSSVAGFGLVLASYEGLSRAVSQILTGLNGEAATNDDLGVASVAAARQGRTDILQSLIRGGAPIDFVCGTLGTALEEASSMGHAQTVAFLLEHNANHSLAAASGSSIDRHLLGTPLQRASTNGYLDIVQSLLNKHADPNLAPLPGTALQRAASGGHEKIMLALLVAGADPNMLGGSFGGTAIQVASRTGHAQCVHLLVQHGGDPDKSEQGTYAAIYHAIFNKKTDAVRVLIESGATLGKGRRTNDTPLHAAIRSEAFEIAKLLLENGAPVNETIAEQSNLLELAIKDTVESSGIVEAILEAGFDVSVVRTPCTISSVRFTRALGRHKTKNLYQKWVKAYRILFLDDVLRRSLCTLASGGFEPWTPKRPQLQTRKPGMQKGFYARPPIASRDRRMIYIRWTDDEGNLLLPEDWTLPEVAPEHVQDELARDMQEEHWDPPPRRLYDARGLPSLDFWIAEYEPTTILWKDSIMIVGDPCISESDSGRNFMLVCNRDDVDDFVNDYLIRTGIQTHAQSVREFEYYSELLEDQSDIRYFCKTERLAEHEKFLREEAENDVNSSTSSSANRITETGIVWPYIDRVLLNLGLSTTTSTESPVEKDLVDVADADAEPPEVTNDQDYIADDLD